MNSVVFADGDDFFKKLEDKYISHDKGFFVLAPSGTGKTHFCKNQIDTDWIDGDDLWISSGAHPNYDWWNKGLDTINRVDSRSDIVTDEAREKGFWIMGASNFWLIPDAIVIPDWETHIGYIKNRETTGYDGGATSDKLEQVKNHIEFMKKFSKSNNVPIFKSIEEAVNNLVN